MALKRFMGRKEHLAHSQGLIEQMMQKLAVNEDGKISSKELAALAV